MGQKSACDLEKSAQELLLEFAQTGHERPFEEIARRYAGMVYNVALQVTRDAHDAEDATQATFLTLAVHAKTEGKIRYVGPWLRKVSQRLALDIRRSKKRRTNREQRHALHQAEANGNGNGNGEVSGRDLAVSNHLQLEELRAVLREELDKLPAKYRMPLILYYFGGLNPEQISNELKCKTSTLGVRLHRGRKMLAESLSEKGVNINLMTVTLALGGVVDGFVKDSLVRAAAHGVGHIGGGGMAASASTAPAAVGLMRCVSSALRWSRMKGIIAAALLLATCLTGGAQILHRLDLLDSKILQRLNPANLIRPLLDRLLRPSNLNAHVEPSIGNNTLLVSNNTFWTTGYVSDGGWNLPYAMGPTQTVESERLLASEFKTIRSKPLSAPPLALAPQFVVNSAPLLKPAVSVTTGFVMALPPTINHQTTPAPPQAKVQAQPQLAMVVDHVSGNVKPGDGSFLWSTGTLHLGQLVVGDTSTGSFTQTGGQVQVDDQVVIGNQVASAGTYTISGSDSTLSAPTVTVGKGGSGTIIQNGGQVNVTTTQHTGQLTLGETSGSKGTYVLHKGKLSADHITVGYSGTGMLMQYGGTAEFNTAQLGEATGGNGLWSVNDGVIQVTAPTADDIVGVPVTPSQSPAPSPAPLIVVGGSGAGTIVLNSDDASGIAIQELPGAQGSTLLVRSSPNGQGTLRGWGAVGVTGLVVDNGKIIADGFGTPHVLDLSAAQHISNTIENPTVGGSNGWYARGGGALVLPSISVVPDKTYTWGEDEQDSTLDLVNSVRFTPHGQGEGEISLTLLDPVNSNAPAMPGGRQALSLWKIDSTLNLSGIDLMVRYDDQMMSIWRTQETDFALWAYNGSWEPITDASAGIDTDQKLIWATADNNPSYFAVALLLDGAPAITTSIPALLSPPIMAAAPEPAVTGLLFAAMAGLLCRRRSR